MGALVILFAKAPIAGQVKTRLIPYLTAETAAPLKDTDIWARYYAEFSNPLVGFMFGAAFTGLVHSSLITIRSCIAS